MQKKAQFWYADFLIAILILVAVSFLFIKNITDLNSKQDKLQSITNDAIAISSFLMSEGYCPDDCLSDWSDPFNKDGRIGLVKEGRIIKNNLNSLIDLVANDNGYQTSKILLGTKNNYIFYFRNQNDIEPVGYVDFYGYYPKINNLEEITAETFVTITRFVYFDADGDNKGEIIKLIIVVW